ncbi:hypothetical protein QL285_034357 [Trifolium repens]|nr:hypothetical protein QL285_034357 [Trifolium repens]
MDVPGKTKDNEKARMDLKLYCKRPEMELQLLQNGKYLKPKAIYSLTSDEAKSVCHLVKRIENARWIFFELGKVCRRQDGKIEGDEKSIFTCFNGTLTSNCFLFIAKPCLKTIAATILATPINATTILDTTNHATILDTTIHATTIHPTTIHTRSRRGTISHVHRSR